MPQQDPSRTEDATQKRVGKAREKGSVAKSAEMGKTVVLLAGLIGMRLVMGTFYEQFHDIFTRMIKEAPSFEANTESVMALFFWCMYKLAILILPVLFIVAGASYAILRWQVGDLWTFETMKFDWGRVFNLAAGFKRLMLDPQALVRMGRSLLQACAVAVAPYLVIKQEMVNLSPLFFQDAHGLAVYILSVSAKMVTYALVPMLLIAAADLWYSRWDYGEQLKMTKEEVKDERRQAEGDPAVKSKQKQKMLQAMAKRMLQDVPKADVVITNPTHLAVALQYDPLVAPAPLVLAKGADLLAMKIREVAKEHDIPIREDKPLAQALYKQVEIGETIPEELFQAVAAILAKLHKFKGRYKK